MSSNVIEKEEVEIQVQYEGYIKKQEKDTKKLLDLEKIKIPANISYDDIKNIASEAREKLKTVEPETLLTRTNDGKNESQGQLRGTRCQLDVLANSSSRLRSALFLSL